MKIKIVLLSLILAMNIGCSSSYKLSLKAHQIIDGFESFDNAEKLSLMKETPFETPAFVFDSGKDGQCIMVLGGTHGNEPAGYEAALRLLELLNDNTPKNGKVIVIPLANRESVNNFDRRIPVPEGANKERGNLNRCYPGDENGLPMEKMAFEIEKLTRENNANVFIDMHEARYFHLNIPKESYRDQGLGQTIIYYPNDESSWIIMNMLDNINETIENKDEHFSAIEQPILHSGAWWAGKYLDIPSFTFETMRKMDLDKRIDYHLQLAKTIFEIYEIW